MATEPTNFFDRIKGYDEEPTRASSAATKRWAARKGYDPDKPETYDRDHVYTRATNSHDHSAKMTVHMPRDQQVFYMKIVNDERTAYDTLADLCRDAMVHQAKYLSDKLADPAYEGEFNILVMKAEAEDFRMVYEAEKAVVEEAAKMLNELASDRAWADLALRIMSYRARVDSLKEPWQSRLAEVLDTAESRLPDDE